MTATPDTMRRGSRPLLLLIAFVVLAGLGWFSGLRDYLSFAYIHDTGDALRAGVAAQPVLAGLGYLGVYILAVVLCLPAIALVTLAGGFLFGFWAGFALALAASVGGATLVFLGTRGIFSGFFRQRAAPLYDLVAGRMDGTNAFSVMLFMRLMPGVPFAAANILPALFGVSLRLFIMATFCGMVPMAAILAWLGRSLGEANSLLDLLSPQILGAFAALALIALGPALIKNCPGTSRKT